MLEKIRDAVLCVDVEPVTFMDRKQPLKKRAIRCSIDGGSTAGDSTAVRSMNSVDENSLLFPCFFRTDDKSLIDFESWRLWVVEENDPFFPSLPRPARAAFKN